MSASKKSKLPENLNYPPTEDIMSDGKQQRVDVDVENLPKRGTAVNTDLKENQPQNSNNINDVDDEIVIVPGTEADVTKEDLDLLENESGDLQNSLNRAKLDSLDEEGDIEDELDVPGSEMDDENESIGEEDEENNYYSLGGDAHDDLEEDRS